MTLIADAHDRHIRWRHVVVRTVLTLAEGAIITIRCVTCSEVYVIVMAP